MNVLVLIGRLTTKKVFIRHFHFSHNSAYSPPPKKKLCITFVFHFSWVLQPSKEKLKTVLNNNNNI